MSIHVDGEIGTQQDQTYEVSSIDLVGQNETCNVGHVIDCFLPKARHVTVLEFHDRDEVCPLKGRLE